MKEQLIFLFFGNVNKKEALILLIIYTIFLIVFIYKENKKIIITPLNVLFGLFKRLVLLPIACIVWLLGHPGIIFFGLFHIIYWLITKRKLMVDSNLFINWCVK